MRNSSRYPAGYGRISTFILQFHLHLPEADDEGVEDAVDGGDPEAVPEFVGHRLVFAERDLRAGKVQLGVVPRGDPEQQRGRGHPSCQEAGQCFHN
jgi:hypothetical protein